MYHDLKYSKKHGTVNETLYCPPGAPSTYKSGKVWKTVSRLEEGQV